MNTLAPYFSTDPPPWADRPIENRAAKTALMFAGASTLTTIAVWASLVAGLPPGPTEPDAAEHPAARSGRPAASEAYLKPARLPRLRPAAPLAPFLTPVQPHAAPSPVSVAAGVEPAPQPASPARLDDIGAILACENKVRNGLPFPDSLRRDLPSTGIYRAPGDNPVVTFDAEATSGFGFPLTVSVQCVFDDSRLARLEVSAR